MGAMLRQTWASYQRHNTQWIAAALAYFATFAIAPLIIVVVELGGLFLHHHRELLNAIYAHMPVSSAKAVEQIVNATFSQRRNTVIAQVAGWAVFVFAAMGLFGSLQYALNTVWDVVPEHLNLLQTIRRRALGFLMMLVAAALLMLLVLATTGLTAAASYLSHLAPGSAGLAKAGDFAITFALVWLLFAVLFEYLPDTQIAWRDVWLGAGMTSLLLSSDSSCLAGISGAPALLRPTAHSARSSSSCSGQTTRRRSSSSERSSRTSTRCTA